MWGLRRRMTGFGADGEYEKPIREIDDLKRTVPGP